MADNAKFGASMNAYTIGAKDPETARKYLSYLHLHSMFGGHVGLPQNIRNEEPNRSLDSARGTYDMLDVYTISGVSVEAGMVVNFQNDTVNNVFGSTYVYPCTDIDKPLGYMVTKATSSTQGVCVLSGILEVPLMYEKNSTISEDEYKDYVEYDLASCTFKFADTGYPVYNVYQDVDGDWIAIILWGKGAGVGGGGIDYNGPFAVSIDHYDEEVPNKMWINCKEGDVILNQIFRRTCEGFEYIVPDPEQEETDELLGNISLSTGESLWLSTALVEKIDTGFPYEDLEFEFLVLTGTPLETTGGSYFKIAENDKDEGLIQIQYGDIRFNRFKAGENIVIDRSAQHPSIKISAPYQGPFDVNLDSIVPIRENDGQGEIVGMSGSLTIADTTNGFPEPLGSTGVVGGHVVVGSNRILVAGDLNFTFTCEQDTFADVYIYKENDWSYKFLVVGRENDVEDAGDELVGKFYTKLATISLWGSHQVQYGDIVQPKDSGGSGEDLQDLVVTPGIVGATVGITSGETSAKFKGDGNVDVTTIRRYATSAERTQWGERSAGIAGSAATALKGAGWRGIYHTIDGSVMTEVSSVASFNYQGHSVEVEYPLIVPDTTDEEIVILSRYMSGLRDSIPQSIINKAKVWAQDRIDEGLPTFYNNNGEQGDNDDALRKVDQESITILGLGQELYSEVEETPVAHIGLTGSKKVITLAAGSNVYFSNEEDNVITINCSGGTVPPSTFYTPNYTSLGIGGTPPETGLGHTFVLPVKAGTVGFFDDGGGAKAVWTDNTGRYIKGLTNSQIYTALWDGWIRVSVIDGGTASGACLSIQDSTGNLPIYKYGSFGTSLFVYNGPFKVSVTPVTANNTTTYTVDVSDGCGRKNSNNQACAGFIVEGTGATTGSSTQVAVLKPSSITGCSAGQEVYLVRTASGGTYTFLVVNSRSGITDAYDFALLIGYIDSNGKAVQVQFGDVTVPSRKLVVDASSSGTVSVAIDGSSNKVKFIEGENITLTGDASNRTITIKATGSSTTVTGLGYPDYTTLGAIPGVVPDAQGITFLIPVQKGHSIDYYTTGSPTVIARYVPCVGESGDSFYLSKGSARSVDADGWVRISVFDNGSTPNDCLLYRDNNHSFPLYKYKSADGGGYGGYGGYGGGGGSVNAPNWSKTGSNQVLITPSNNNPYTTTSAGWVYACARVTNGDAHILVNGAEFKVASARGSGNNAGGSICIPVRSGVVIQWEASNYDEAFAAFYPT